MAVFLMAKWSVVSRHWVRTRPWFVLFWCVVAALGALVPSVWLQEHMPELPNLVEGEFDMIMKDRMGYFVVGLLAPLAEEMVFRGAILRSLLRWKSNPWVGIVISAILFAVIHMNPAQMPHAFLISLLLGWMYWRTDSIVPGVVYHWVNNTVAYILYNIYPNPDLTLLDLFGSDQKVWMALGFSLLIFLPSLFQLNQRLSK
jgi:membrane protease YdiL (CAAX protease family)